MSCSGRYLHCFSVAIEASKSSVIPATPACARWKRWERQRKRPRRAGAETVSQAREEGEGEGRAGISDGGLCSYGRETRAAWRVSQEITLQWRGIPRGRTEDDADCSHPRYASVRQPVQRLSLALHPLTSRSRGDRRRVDQHHPSHVLALPVASTLGAKPAAENGTSVACNISSSCKGRAVASLSGSSRER